MRLFKVLTILGVVGLVVYKGPSLVSSVRRKTKFSQCFSDIAEKVDHSIGWHKLPSLLGVLVLGGLRGKLRSENLYDTESTAPSTAGPVPAPPADGRHLTQRMADGTYNDLNNPRMGSAGSRFGRNVPIEFTYPEAEENILTPSPRTVSLELMTRHTFHPATTLNVIAAAWIQFMIRDWFSHGPSPKENPWKIPLMQGDKWHENPMTILRTRPDPMRTTGSNAPPTYANTETPWWDGSQLYGTDKAIQSRVRSGIDGKLRVDPEGLVQIDPNALLQPGAWLGLVLMHNLFTLEHNAICDRLRSEYPSWSDDDLFERARLINAALIAKIHTVEWTPGILGHPTLQIAMRANWWGIATERVHKLFGRISKSEFISGIPGSATNHYGVPYSLTEEFVAVYRMHPLIPDEYIFRSAGNDRVLQKRSFPDIAGAKVQDVLSVLSMADLLYSFGIANPGSIHLHNFPRFLQRYERPDGVIMDLAATDILRSRELGVPKYNQFRRLFHLKPVESFDKLSYNPEWAEEIRRVYDGDIDRVDLMVGLYAERPPRGFGFSDTAFRIFILMASRRLNSDRFFTVDYRPEVYAPAGMRWIDDNTMSTVLLRHYPQLAPALKDVSNAFAPWTRVA